MEGDVMTVKKMIEMLSKMPPEALCLVDGYEDGYDRAKEPRDQMVYVSGYGTESCIGEFKDRPQVGESQRARRAVIIER
jgi:hypothetical protein